MWLSRNVKQGVCVCVPGDHCKIQRYQTELGAVGGQLVFDLNPLGIILTTCQLLPLDTIISSSIILRTPLLPSQVCHREKQLDIHAHKVSFGYQHT